MALAEKGESFVFSQPCKYGHTRKFYLNSYLERIKAGGGGSDTWTAS